MKKLGKKVFVAVITVLAATLMMLSLGACDVISTVQDLAPTNSLQNGDAPTQPEATEPVETQPEAIESAPTEVQPPEEAAEGEVEVLTFAAVADAETRSGDDNNRAPADKSFGTNPKVTYVKGATNERRGFMMFNVEGVGDSKVKSAKLLVYYASTGGGDPVGSTQVYLTETNWNEETMTHNTQPALGEMIIEYNNEGIEVGQWQTIDVTDYVKADGTYSFAFVGKDSTVRLDFASKEFTDPAMQPSLVIEKEK